MADSENIARLQRNLRDELDSAALYRSLADLEADPVRADLFRQLASSEADHAEIWRSKLLAAGVVDTGHGPSLRTRTLAFLARHLGVGFVLPSIASAEVADQNKYAGQADATALSGDERGHAAVVRTLVAKGPTTGADIAKAEQWHRGASGNELRAAVLGANDGLVSNFCLIMGVAGAGVANREILLTGFAGLVAGACSMALGEWLSVTNARELARTQMDREAEEIEQTPESERRELALIYQAKGLARAQAETFATEIMKDKDKALDTLAREELGIDPAELGGNPWSAAGVSFGLFSAGACFPVAPFLWSSGPVAMASCVALSAFALAAIGVTTSLFNGRSAAFSAGRQVVIGCIAAAATYGAGRLLGVSIS